MVPDPALERLKDIHLPETIGFWPLAPGWYVLFFLVLFVLLWAISWFIRHQKHGRAKKQALQLLDEYERQYAHDNKGTVASARVSELLKRVALVYFPRQDVAAMQGEEWVCFLLNTSKHIDFQAIQWMLLESPFRTDESRSVTPLIHAARAWIQQRKKPCSN